MSLNAFPDTELIVPTHANDITGRVCQREDSSAVSLYAVHASAGEEVPDTEHPVLRTRSGAAGVDRVYEGRRDWTAVAVKGVDRHLVVQTKNSQSVVLRKRVFLKKPPTFFSI